MPARGSFVEFQCTELAEPCDLLGLFTMFTTPFAQRQQCRIYCALESKKHPSSQNEMVLLECTNRYHCDCMFVN